MTRNNMDSCSLLVAWFSVTWMLLYIATATEPGQNAEEYCLSVNGRWFTTTSSCFQYFDDTYTWAEADSLCGKGTKGMSGHLVVISSSAVYGIIKTMLTRDTWFGLKARDPNTVTRYDGSGQGFSHKDEWAFFKGDTVLANLSWVPPLVVVDSNPPFCMRIRQSGGSFAYDDYQCNRKLRAVCEFTEINECQSNPCMNGGSCHEHFGSFSCSCESNYTGNLCETEITCSDLTTCVSCYKIEKCGWCDTTSSCMDGNAADATNFNCATWFYRSCLTTDDSTTCSDNINKTNCIDNLCSNATTPKQQFLCQKCRDFHDCFKDNTGGCRSWDEDKCPGGYLNPNLTEPQRINQVVLKPEVSIIDPKKTTLYVCDTNEGIGQMAIAVENPTANYTGRVLSSFQSGVILHKVFEVRKKSSWDFLITRPAGLPEVFEQAEFAYRITEEDTKSHFREDETPSDFVIRMLMETTSTEYSSYDLSEVDHLYRLVGTTELDADDATKKHSVLVVPKSAAAPAKVGDVVFSNSTVRELEVVDELQALSAGETLLKTHLAQFDSAAPVTYDAATLLLSEANSFSCAGGDMSPGINVFSTGKEESWMATGNVIVGRKTGAVALEVAAIHDGGDFTLYEGYPITSVDETGQLFTSFQLAADRVQSKVKRGSRVKRFDVPPVSIPCVSVIREICGNACKDIKCQTSFTADPKLTVSAFLDVDVDWKKIFGIPVQPDISVDAGVGVQLVLDTTASADVSFTIATTLEKSYSKTLKEKRHYFTVTVGGVPIKGDVTIKLAHELSFTVENALKVGFTTTGRLVNTYTAKFPPTDLRALITDDSFPTTITRNFEPIEASATATIQYDIGPSVTVTWPSDFTELLNTVGVPKKFIPSSAKMDIHAKFGVDVRAKLTGKTCECCTKNLLNPHNVKAELGPYVTLKAGAHLLLTNPTPLDFKEFIPTYEKSSCMPALFDICGLINPRCKDEDQCISDPCLNEATCIDHLGKYTCSCVKGYTGDRCQTDIDECSSSPCLHGATCHNLIGSYNCKCAWGYSGDRCEKKKTVPAAPGSSTSAASVPATTASAAFESTSAASGPTATGSVASGSTSAASKPTTTASAASGSTPATSGPTTAASEASGSTSAPPGATTTGAVASGSTSAVSGPTTTASSAVAGSTSAASGPTTTASSVPGGTSLLSGPTTSEALGQTTTASAVSGTGLDLISESTSATSGPSTVVSAAPGSTTAAPIPTAAPGSTPASAVPTLTTTGTSSGQYSKSVVAKLLKKQNINNIS